MQHDEIKDLLAAYALGAVSTDERSEIDRHVSACDECSAELADYEAVTGTLARAVAPVEPPPGFTERTVAAAIVDRPAPVAVPSATRWGRLGILAGAALLAATVVIGTTVLESRQDSQRKEEVVALLETGEGISLTGEGDVIGRVVGDEFALAGVGPAPEGKTYQLWLMRGDDCPSDEPAGCELVSAGTFDTEDGVALVELEEPSGEWDDAAVTIEDDEGAGFPTTEPFVDSL